MISGEILHIILCLGFALLCWRLCAAMSSALMKDADRNPPSKES